MWDEKELSKELNDYFDNVSQTQFEEDLKKVGCIDLIVDIEE